MQQMGRTDGHVGAIHASLKQGRVRLETAVSPVFPARAHVARAVRKVNRGGEHCGANRMGIMLCRDRRGALQR